MSEHTQSPDIARPVCFGCSHCGCDPNDQDDYCQECDECSVKQADWEDATWD